MIADHLSSGVQGARQEGSVSASKNVIAIGPDFCLGIPTRPRLPSTAASSRMASIDRALQALAGLCPCIRQCVQGAGT